MSSLKRPGSFSPSDPRRFKETIFGKAHFDPVTPWPAVGNQLIPRNGGFAVNGEQGGAWTAEVHHALYPNNLNRGLVRFLAHVIEPKDMIEFGCGVGDLANALASEVRLEPSYCIEPLIDAKLFGPGLNLLNIDIFSDPLPAEINRKFDLVLSIEVAEHVERSLHARLFDFFLERACRFVVFSGARPGQGGHGHIAERPEEEWREEFVSRGFAFDAELTLLARTMSDEKNINHRRNVQVFRA